MRSHRQLNRFRNLSASRRRMVHGGLMNMDEKTPEQIENERLLKVYDEHIDSCVGKGYDPSENKMSDEALEAIFNSMCSR